MVDSILLQAKAVPYSSDALLLDFERAAKLRNELYALREIAKKKK